MLEKEGFNLEMEKGGLFPWGFVFVRKFFPWGLSLIVALSSGGGAPAK